MYLDKNMEMLEKKHSYLYEKLVQLNLDELDTELDDIALIETRESENALVIQKDEKIYRMNSIYRPLAEVSKWADQYSFMNLYNVVIMYGFGSGLFAGELLKRMGKEDVLIIYEPSIEIFSYILRNKDITDLLVNSALIITVEGVNEEVFHLKLNQKVTMDLLVTKFTCVHPHYETVFPEGSAHFWKEIRDNAYFIGLNRNTKNAFGKRFIENTFNNLKYVRGSSTLHQVAPHVPEGALAIVVSAGPSLERNLDKLRELQSKVFIVVVDRSVPIVLEAGIKPDLIATIDPIKPASYFEGSKLTVPMLCTLHSNPELIDKHQGMKIFVGSNLYISDLYDKLELPAPYSNTGGSVATASFNACINMGFKNIILLGQDLAYEGNRTHAGGAIEETTQNDIMIDGIDGELVRSRLDWYNFVNFFQDVIRELEGYNIIDAKDRGAKIEGTTVMELEKAIQLYGNDNIDHKSIVPKIESLFTEEKLLEMQGLLKESLAELDKVKKNIHNAIECSERLILECEKNGATSPIASTSLKELKKINAIVKEISLYTFIESILSTDASDDIVSLGEYAEDELENKVSVYSSAKKIYEVVEEGSDFIRPLLVSAIENIL